MIKIIVHGAGSIGCFVGGAWAHAGLDVMLVGRARIGDIVHKHGMHLSDYQGFDIFLAAENIPFTEDPSALATADIIALAVKCTGTEAAASEIDRYAKHGAVVLSLQNGISNVDTLTRLLPRQTVVAGMVPYNVANLGDGHWHKGTQGHLMAACHPALVSVEQAASKGPAALTLVENMPAVAWGKLLINLNNAVNALSGETLLNELSQRAYRQVVAATIREALTVLDVARITPAKIGPMPPRRLARFIAGPNFIFNTVGLRLQKIDARARSSMAEDFDTGRATEIDYLNGEVVKLGKQHNIPTPFNSAVVSLVRDAEAGGRKNWSANDLKKHVLGA